LRQIKVDKISRAVASLLMAANFRLASDVISALKKAQQNEESPLAREVLNQLLENANIAQKEQLSLCQDCGTAVIFIDIGQDVHIIDGDLNMAITEGVRQGYTHGFLRKSMVSHPFSTRINTLDNTPPIIHVSIIPGEQLKITVMPKGGGAENMSRLAMLKPSEGRQGIVDFVVDTVDRAGGKACPPLIVGVGIGGTAEQAMIMAKRALLRKVGQPSRDDETAELERDLLAQINNLGIGPLGFGGRYTALAVHTEVMPTHIASLPVAVNLQCHSIRHREMIL
jgi:fumarate hydratase subunit alpha